MSFDENISMLSMAFYKVIMICGPLLGKMLKKMLVLLERQEPADYKKLS